MEEQERGRQDGVSRAVNCAVRPLLVRSSSGRDSHTRRIDCVEPREQHVAQTLLELA